MTAFISVTPDDGRLTLMGEVTYKKGDASIY